MVPGLLGGAQVASVGGEHQLQRLGQVLQQVEAVRDLHRLGRAAAGSLGIRTRPVARDHGDAGVGAQPGRERVRLAVGQQRHRVPPLQVHQHGAVGVSFTHRPVVHTEGGRGHDGRHGGSPDQVQQRVAARRQPELAAEACAGRPAQRQSQSREP
jgi:hypothetical protein